MAQSHNAIRKILTGLGVCLVTSLASGLAYVASGWSPLDAAYMVIITLFGIGYGEVHPVQDPWLRMQTMTLIIIGCLSGLYSVGGFLQLITEGEIKKVLGAQKMSRGIKKLNNHTIVCGYGRVGRMLATDLAARNIPLVIIDQDSSRLANAEEHGHAVICGDASCDEILEAAGIHRAKSLATALPNDAFNVFITLTARDLNPRVKVVARAESPKTESKLRRSGARHVIMPSTIGATRMAQIITSGYQEEVESVEGWQPGTAEDAAMLELLRDTQNVARDATNTDAGSEDTVSLRNPAEMNR